MNGQLGQIWHSNLTHFRLPPADNYPIRYCNYYTCSTAGRSAARLARLLREQEVPGSNPGAPILLSKSPTVRYIIVDRLVFRLPRGCSDILSDKSECAQTVAELVDVLLDSVLDHFRTMPHRPKVRVDSLNHVLGTVA